MTDEEAPDNDAGADAIWNAAIAAREGIVAEPAPAQAQDDVVETEEAPPPPSEDIWADAPEPLRAAFSEIKAAKEAAESKWDRHRNQQNGQSRRIADLERQLAQSTATTPAPEEAAALVKLRELYPEIGELLEPVVGRVDELSRRFDSAQTRTANLAVERESEVISAIDAKHPDFEGFIASKSDEFWEWVEDQPKKFRDIASANKTTFVDAAGVSDLLDRFKAHISPPTKSTPDPRPERRTRQLDGASAPAPRGGAVVGEREPTTADEIWNAGVKRIEARNGVRL